jgi:hypothetical protein
MLKDDISTVLEDEALKHGVDVPVTNSLQPICRSIKCFVRAVPGNLILRMMFPLRTAYDSLSEGSIEKECVQSMFLWIGRTRPMESSVILPEEFSE